MLKIAIPMQGGHFSAQFGGADRFAIFEVDEQARRIMSLTSATPPAHEQGSFPTWLKEQGCNREFVEGRVAASGESCHDHGFHRCDQHGET